MSFPAKQSHYSRHDNPGRLYLSLDLSIARMYQMFLVKHDPQLYDNPGRLYLSLDLSIARMYQMFLVKHDPQLLDARKRGSYKPSGS